jgi:hypothetical protein
VRFEQIDKRFSELKEYIDKRFEVIGKRLDGLSRRFLFLREGLMLLESILELFTLL